MNKLRYALPIWLFLGSLYLTLEGIWRMGWVHPSMQVVGGLCAVSVGAINHFERFYKLKIVWQSLIGAVIVLCVEFAAGCVINLWLGWGVWDYAGMPGNIMGQICLPYALLWFALMPFAIWAEDAARWCVWSWYELRGKPLERPLIEPYGLADVYRELVTGK